MKDLEMENGGLNEAFWQTLNELARDLYREINSSHDLCLEESSKFCTFFKGKLNTIRTQMEEIQSNWTLCKKAMTLESIPSEVPKIDVPRPKSYMSVRNARELNNYFGA